MGVLHALAANFVDENLKVSSGILSENGEQFQTLPKTTAKDTAKFFRILGIGVFTQGEFPKLAGFAPAPPDDELVEPQDL